MRIINNYKAPWAVALVVLMATTQPASNAAAQNINADFTVGVSGSASVLYYADDPIIGPIMQSDASWVGEAQLKRSFNEPALLIANSAESLGNLVQFELTIGDDDYHFRNLFYSGALTEDVPNFISPVTVNSAVTTPSGAPALPGAIDAERLIVDFGSGIVAGDMALFKIKIGADADPMLLPSFEDVFFDVSTSLTENALVTLTYELGAERASTTPIPLYELLAPPTTPHSLHMKQAVLPHITPGSLNTVPEPTALLLLAAGSMSLATMRRRSR
ncbi:MAG: PEP-CTERM sorting domain-containing protein [Pirellulales bacterium]|nr:PEP-CTERM sorting domain-containing protein [Pirellulales bacterium]